MWYNSPKKTNKMRTIALLIFSLLIVNTAFTQSKKEMDQKILQIEEKTKNLENDITNIKTNLLNTTTTLGLVSKSNLDLEKLVKEQSLHIEKLIKQNDSLLIVFKVTKDADFVTIPKNEEDSIILLIQSYYASKKWGDRLGYVLKPEAVKSFMKDYYTDNYKSTTIKKDEISVQGSGYKTNQNFKVIINKQIVYCKKTSDGFKIDWEATAQYNNTALRTFNSEKSTSPTTFRLKLVLNSSYRDDYKLTSSNYYSITASSKSGVRIQLYIKKTTIGASEIKKLLTDGKVHHAILEIKYRTLQHKEYPGGEIPNKFIFITKFIQKEWSKIR